MSEPQKRGRKPKGLNQLRVVKNVSLDAEVQAMLAAQQERMEPKFGFRPTLSQTIRYLVNQANRSGEA